MTLRPLSGAAAAAVDAGISIERRAVDAVLDSAELERVLMATLDSPRIQGRVAFRRRERRLQLPPPCASRSWRTSSSGLDSISFETKRSTALMFAAI